MTETSILQSTPDNQQEVARLEDIHATSFIDLVRSARDEMRTLPVIDRSGATWQGKAITLPSEARADVFTGLDIEEVENEITVSFDYSHIHLEWPPRARQGISRIWWDGLALVEAILNETVVASSGWIDGRLRIGMLHEVSEPPEFRITNLQHIRVRSWRGTFNRDGMAQ